MTINFQTKFFKTDSQRVFIVFSSDDMTVLFTFLSENTIDDIKIHTWICDNGYNENRIEYIELNYIN